MINIDKARQWLGRIDVRADHAGPLRLAALSATLDRDDPALDVGEPVPLLGHWLFFVRPERQSDIARDGSGRGSFLPPIELSRRIWVGSRLHFRRPLRVGDAISRTSCIVDIAEERGPSGPLVSVLVRHEIGDAEGIALSEDQTFLFRDRQDRGATDSVHTPRTAPQWSRWFHADERTLFRFAALTFDARRVHYDRPYATFVEGHPGLLVQDELVANLLLDLLRRHAPDAQVTGCHVRAIRPLFDTEPFWLCGNPLDASTALLWAEDARGALAMEVVATLASEGDVGVALDDVSDERPSPPDGPPRTLRRHDGRLTHE